MAAIAAIGAVVLLAGAGLAWTARLVHVSNLDALELARKVSVPNPVSALDWPELRVRAIVPQPGDQSLVLLLVGWPAYPRRAATLLLAIDSGYSRSVPLLSLWCATQAPVSPTRLDGAGLELRRRQSLERVHAVLVAEDYTALNPAQVYHRAGVFDLKTGVADPVVKAKWPRLRWSNGSAYGTMGPFGWIMSL
jgi:hypothetical protein